MVIMKYICVFISIISIAKALPESLPKRNLKTIPVVDALIHRLEVEEWAEDEVPCSGATLRILNSVRNGTLWATWIWDSMQPPLGVFYGSGLSLGNFDQCINTPWSSQHELSTQYCLVHAKFKQPKEPREFMAFDSAHDYFNTLSIHGRTFNRLDFGVCMPVVCSRPAVAKVFRHMLQMTYVPDAEAIVDTSDCQVLDQDPYPGNYYAFLYVLGALISIVVASTIYTYFNDNKESTSVDAIAKSFSITHNWTDLFKVNKNEIRVLNGMRVITAILVIGNHQCLLSLSVPSMLINTLEVDTLFKNELSQGLIHLDLIVDTFFAISGMLLIRGLMGGRQKNLMVVLLKRYFRLIGPYAATTFYIMCMARYTGSGPVWLRENAYEENVCEKHWWKNFLMLNYDIKTMCYGVAWYVTCDYHLAILTVVLFWVYRRSSRSGVVAFVAVSCGLTVQLAVMAYRKRLPLVPFGNVNDVSEIRKFDVMNDLYIRWHDRAGSYLVGIGLGWVMSMYKPADHRNVISKTNSFIIVLLSLYLMMKMATINHWLSNGRVEVAIAIATNRVLWAVAICALIAACEYGSVLFISDFLGSSIFVPISKLCYGIYMVHFFIIQRNLHVMRTPLYFDIFNVVVCTLGTTVLACVAALLLHMLVEAPCINLSNCFLSERNDKAELNTAKTSNVSSKASNGSIHQNGTNGTTKMKKS